VLMPDVESISLDEEKMQCATRSAGIEALLGGWGAAHHLRGVEQDRRATERIVAQEGVNWAFFSFSKL
jgi:hypothetical protein